MRTPLLLIAAATAAGAASSAQAQENTGATFAPPVQLRAGDKLLGHKRLYPSPVYHDVDRDGDLDIVVGDLPGKLTVALRQPGSPATFAAETDLLGADGKGVKFHNW